jgi:hypothetical protein
MHIGTNGWSCKHIRVLCMYDLVSDANVFFIGTVLEAKGMHGCIMLICILNVYLLLCRCEFMYV